MDLFENGDTGESISPPTENPSTINEPAVQAGEDQGHYVVYARKWRPQTFDEVVGQKHVSESLKNAISNQRLSHAYLFTGPRGVGKTSMARILSKALNCLSSDQPTTTTRDTSARS